MYNPSKANHLINDNSVNNCIIAVSRLEEYGSIEIVNLFSTMATKPSELSKADRKTTKENIKFIKDAFDEADLIIVGWGAEGGKVKRDKEVLKLLQQHKKKLKCFGLTPNSKKPIHPRALSYDAELMEYKIRN